MKFLVFGSTGMAGHMIALYLTERGHEVCGTARHQATMLEERGVRIHYLDVQDLEAVKKVLTGNTFDVVVNCIGLLNKECDERPDLAVYLNSYFPHLLETLTCNMVTRVFHLSTDCVFAGNSGPYSENSIPDGETFYDKTKALGELRNNKDLTLRQSIVGPDVDPNGIGLFNWFMRQEGSINGYSKAIWTGMTTLELAKAIEFCAADGSKGLINMVPEGLGVSKYELLRLFNETCKNGTIQINPFSDFKLDKSLVQKNHESAFKPQSYKQQVQEIAEWISSHASLYPHYVMK